MTERSHWRIEQKSNIHVNQRMGFHTRIVREKDRTLKGNMSTVAKIALSSWLLIVVGCQTPESAPVDVAEVTNPEYGLWQEENSARSMQLILEQVFGGERSDSVGLITSIVDAAVDDEYNLYVYDRIGRLVSFMEDGTVRWATGRSGEGPGEFRNVQSIRWDGSSYLYVANLGGTRIDRFNEDGEYVDSHLTESLEVNSVSLIGFLESGNLVVDHRKLGSLGARIYTISVGADWSILDTFSVDQTGARIVPIGIGLGPEVSIVGNMIVAAHMTEYSYTWYDRVGNIHRRVSRSGVRIEPPHIYPVTGGVAMNMYTEMYAPQLIADDRWLGGGSWPINVRDPDEYEALRQKGTDYPLVFDHNIDVFDEGGHLLYSFSSAELDAAGFGRPFASDTRGRVYASLIDRDAPLGRFQIDAVLAEHTGE